jgi:o-succinylbenzoate---CoA ligase
MNASLSVFEAAAAEPGRLALLAGSERLSYAELAVRVEQRLGELSAGGLIDPAGQRPVALVARPTITTVETLLALFAAGTPALLLHERSTTHERAGLVSRAGAVAFEAATGTSPVGPIERFDSERIAVLIATSGSSGQPKLARLSHRALLAAARQSADHLGVEPADRWLACLPLGHVGGVSILTRMLFARRTSVLFDPEGPLLHALPRLARAIDEEEITLLSLVPALLERLLAPPISWSPPSHLRAVLLGGAATSSALLRKAAERGVPVLPTYGLTETAAQAATRPYRERGLPPALDSPLAPSGVPLPGVEIRIVDGAIEVRGPSLFSGYAGDSDEIGSETWFRTQDRGYFDANGELVVSGRTSDVIVTGGENVDPAEVEAVLTTVPGVRGACVVGLPDEVFGEVVAALVVADTEDSERLDLAASLRERLAPFKHPRRWHRVQELPLLPSGKLDRAAARRLLLPPTEG